MWQLSCTFTPSSQTLERLWHQNCHEVRILMHVRVAHGGICMALQEPTKLSASNLGE